jgi:hypothetical protein
MKISAGLSQSQGGDKSFETVQYSQQNGYKVSLQLVKMQKITIKMPTSDRVGCGYVFTSPRN